jgi:hypothetical protein
MARFATAMLALSACATTPAAAQELPLPFIPDDEPIHVRQRGFSFPTINYTAPTGETRQRKGILIGRQVAPNTLVGVGLFETAPKLKGYTPEGAEGRAKGKRRAAVGLSLRF